MLELNGWHMLLSAVLTIYDFKQLLVWFNNGVKHWLFTWHVFIKVGHIDAMAVWWNLETFDCKSKLYIAKKIKGLLFSYTHDISIFIQFKTDLIWKVWQGWRIV